MFLTQIRIDKTEAARVKLWDRYGWHRALWHAFPEKEDKEDRFLFRVDDFRTYFQTLLLSEINIVDQPWGGKGNWQTKEFSDDFLNHSTYRFQLKANPTMKKTFPEGKKRIGLYKEELLRDWMSRKAKNNGFTLDESTLIVGAPMDETFRKGNKTGKLVSVDFKGSLTVENQVEFIHAFKNGIGTAKAFGFGMLMLQPIK
ncbi:type I-E CRISPR-associated protein Cas6/Cse3/CasE [bacterium]|nr:type I-E CRISPR-associated protein Cas6/Cse3/CasE [bacterium]